VLNNQQKDGRNFVFASVRLYHLNIFEPFNRKVWPKAEREA